MVLVMSALQVLSLRVKVEKYDYCGKASARLTEKALGYEIIGTFNTCEASSIGKARQKNGNKD
jgi:hypothetical protein